MRYVFENFTTFYVTIAPDGNGLEYRSNKS